MSASPRAPVSLLVLATLWVGCASAPSRPEAGPPFLTVQETSLTSQDLTDVAVRFSGQLQAPAPAVLERADYELVSEGRVLKTGTAALGVALQAGAPADFSFEERATYVSGPEDLQALSARGGNLLVALRGTLTVRTGERLATVPFAASREVRVPRLPEVVLHSLDAGRYSDEEVNLILRVGVRNPNPFPVRLGALSWALSVGGRAFGEGTLASAATLGASALGEYPLEVSVTRDTWGPGVKALLARGSLPWRLSGELAGPLMRVPYHLDGDVKLQTSRPAPRP
ncbi:LEA type 2 family protein [Myxococcaceae bacterium GXIMD 01537]